MENSFGDFRKDQSDRFLLKLRNIQGVKETQKSRWKFISTLSSRNDHFYIMNLLENMALSVPYTIAA